MTPAQSRAARALLHWSQLQLANAAKISEGTLRNFEAGRSVPIANTLHALRAALEAAGVKFTNGGEPGIKLRKSISGAQIRAGRLLLQWSPEGLAERAKVSVKIIKRSEAAEGKPMVRMGHGVAIRYALERAGVVFVDENGQGPGVRLSKGYE
jgi:ribosome-binding protein aMBF1 (putative translation factor)